jgi:hypothetical protein
MPIFVTVDILLADMLLGDPVALDEAAREEVVVEAVVEVIGGIEVAMDSVVVLETDVVVEFWVMLK